MRSLARFLALLLTCLGLFGGMLPCEDTCCPGEAEVAVHVDDTADDCDGPCLSCAACCQATVGVLPSGASPVLVASSEPHSPPTDRAPPRIEPDDRLVVPRSA